MVEIEDRLLQRLGQLREELSRGEQMLQDLQAQEAELQQKLLRISGAIQVLEETLADSEAGESPPESAEAADTGS